MKQVALCYWSWHISMECWSRFYVQHYFQIACTSHTKTQTQYLDELDGARGPMPDATHLVTQN